MVFSYEKEVIFKYFWIKYKYGATRTVNNHPEYEWNVNGAKKLLKKTEDTSDGARKEGSGWRMSICTEDNIGLVKEMFLSLEDQSRTHSTSAEIARELSIDRPSVCRIIHQDLDLHTVREMQGAKTY